MHCRRDMKSTIGVEAPLAATIHALTFAVVPADPALLRERLAAAQDALDALEAALSEPLPEVAGPARRAYHAALALALAAAAKPAIERTAAHMLDVLGPLVQPEDHELREATLPRTGR